MYREWFEIKWYISVLLCADDVIILGGNVQNEVAI
jgi:hypothetical protein